jgi:GNAT superfamily N-acetyltransferase
MEPTAPSIRIAESDDDVMRCFPVMAELRPHLEPDAFLPRIRRMQRENGFWMAFAEEGGEVRAVAGYRFLDLLFSGMTLYVDDLVTDPRHRSSGHGRALLHWLQGQAREKGCATLTLDSGVHRFDAHRFYFRERMHIHGYHFTLPLDAPA